MDDARRPDHVDAVRAMFFALLAAAGVRGLQRFVPGWPPEAFGLLQQSLFFAVPLLYSAAVRLPPLRASGFIRLPLRQAVLVLLGSFGTMWLLQGLNELQPPLLEWLGLGKEVRREKELLVQGLRSAQAGGTLFAAVLYGVVSPLCEETLFRGLVFRGLARRSGPLLPLVLTTVLFAAMHGTWVQFALMLVLGFYFGLLRWLTGSLWAGILAHAANNFAVLILSAQYGPEVDAIRGPWWVYPLSAIVFAGAMMLLALDRRERGATST
jgi:membrane protease YdiL (CAAX protease family)